MRIVRFRPKPDSPATWGWLRNDRVGIIQGSPFAEFRRQTAKQPLDSVRLLPPVQPRKIIGLTHNFPLHAEEPDMQQPSIPILFLKPPSAIIGPDEAILLPPQSKWVEHGANLAVVIGYGGRWIRPDEVDDRILGYTAANDISAKDLLQIDRQPTRSKGFDTFCPLGPWIETDLDPADVLITATVNGQMRQMASTRDMVFPIRQLVAFVSSVMTLESGDVILAGTPEGAGQLRNGDTITVEIEGLGRLTNPIRKAPIANNFNV